MTGCICWHLVNVTPNTINADDYFQTMGNPRKTKDKKNKEPASKACETPRREEGTTARAGEAEEPSTSQV